MRLPFALAPALDGDAPSRFLARSAKGSAGMQRRKVGPFEVSAIGFGCMGLSSGYGPPTPRERAEQVLKGALDAGHTFFDTAAVYGLGHNETLAAEVLGPHRAKFTLAS